MTFQKYSDFPENFWLSRKIPTADDDVQNKKPVVLLFVYCKRVILGLQEYLFGSLQKVCSIACSTIPACKFTKSWYGVLIFDIECLINQEFLELASQMCKSCNLMFFVFHHNSKVCCGSWIWSWKDNWTVGVFSLRPVSAKSVTCSMFDFTARKNPKMCHPYFNLCHYWSLVVGLMGISQACPDWPLKLTLATWQNVGISVPRIR